MDSFTGLQSITLDQSFPLTDVLWTALVPEKEEAACAEVWDLLPEDHLCYFRCCNSIMAPNVGACECPCACLHIQGSSSAPGGCSDSWCTSCTCSNPECCWHIRNGFLYPSPSLLCDLLPDSNACSALCIGMLLSPIDQGQSFPLRDPWGFPSALAPIWKPISALSQLTPLMWHLTTNYSQQFGASVTGYLHVFIPGYHPTAPASEAAKKAAISKEIRTCNLVVV